MRANTVDTFWSRVDRTGSCWLWLALKDKDGYGRIRWAGKWVRAHRLVYTLVVGDIPPGAMILHSCDNPSCVRPEHLRVGDASANMRDAVDRGRHNMTRRTHCPQGHPYEGDNVVSNGSGRKRCRTCRDAGYRARYYGPGC
jgi:hypothetical protein